MLADGLWALIPTIETVEPYATTVAAMAIVLIAIQVGLQRRTVHTDEARLARESAIFVHSVFGAEEFRVNRKLVGAKHTQAIDNMSHETISAFKSVLHSYGLVALAFEEGGVSAKVIESYWGSILVKDWNRLKGFVAKEREANPLLHLNTEHMVIAVKAIERVPSAK